MKKDNEGLVFFKGLLSAIVFSIVLYAIMAAMIFIGRM